MIVRETNREAQKSLFAVVFEVQLNPSHADEYVRIAAALRSHLMQIEGFIRNERFRSRTRADVLLSLSFWDNEKALVRWRSMAVHHHAQSKGRGGIFDDYHLRVGEVMRSSVRFTDRELGWMRHDTTEVGRTCALTIIETDSSAWPDPLHLVDQLGGASGSETYEHLDDPRHTLTLIEWPGPDQEDKFLGGAMQTNTPAWQLYSLRIIRDYGLMDRREAPQFRPPHART